jgi:transglutaminase-like putative cysteine protease
MAVTPHSPDLSDYLRPTDFIDSDSPDVVQYAHFNARHEATDVGRVVALYYAVRDGIRYNPYSVDLSVNGMRASSTLKRESAFCVPKAVLLAAAARALHIPSRLGFADVKNHFASKRLLRLMQTDLFVFHGYTELFLNGKWVKATPAFNRSLCDRFNVAPLEFDGYNDSVFQQYDSAGNQFMEYVRDRGQFQDVPLDEMRAAFQEHYPALMAGQTYIVSGVFEDDVVAD